MGHPALAKITWLLPEESPVFTVAYCRVSKIELDPENQKLEIAQAGYTPTLTAVEHGVSGKVAAAERPEFSRILKLFADMDPKAPKQLVATKIDRIGRDAEDVLATVRKLQALGVEVIVLQLGKVDLTSSMGKMILTTLAAVAELERALITERIHSGLAKARAKKTRLGRPEALKPAEVKAVAKALGEGQSVRGLAAQYNVARGTIRRVRAAAA